MRKLAKLAGRACLVVLISSVSIAQAEAQAVAIRAMYDEAKALVDYTDDEMVGIKRDWSQLGGEPEYDKNIRAYEKARSAILDRYAKLERVPEDEEGKGLAVGWKIDYPRVLAESLKELGTSFAYADGQLFEARRRLISREQKDACLKVHSDLGSVVENVNSTLDQHRLYSEEARDATRPFARTIETRLAEYNLEIHANRERYYSAADVMNKRRGKLARRYWRFWHAYEEAGLEHERDEISDVLYSGLGNDREAYLNPVQIAKHFTAFQSGYECPYKLATRVNFEFNAVLPETTGWVGDRIKEPVASFDEQENFLPRPPVRGTTLLERAASNLSFRQVQRFRILREMEIVSGRLRQANSEYLDALSVANELRRAVENYRKGAAPLVPALELERTIATLEADLEELSGELQQLQAEWDAERQNQLQAETDARLSKFVQIGVDETGLDKYRPTKAGESGRTVSEIVSRLKRERILPKNDYDRVKVRYDTFLEFGLKSKTTSHTTKWDTYVKLKADLKKFEALLKKVDRRIAHAESLRVESDFDDTKLVALNGAKAAKRAAFDQTEDALSQAKNTLERTRASGSVELAPFARDMNSLLDRVNALAPDLRRSTAATRAPLRILSQKQDPELSASQINEQADAFLTSIDALIDPVDAAVQTKLVAVQGAGRRGAELGLKLEVVNDTLVTAKRLATNALVSELPSSGIPSDDDLVVQLEDYRGAVSKINEELTKGSKLIKEKASQIDQAYDLFAGGMSYEQKLGVQRVVASMKWVDGYVEEVSQATELIGTATDKVIEVAKFYNDLKPPSNSSPASAFAHIQSVLKRAEKVSTYVPVVGLVSEYYFGYMYDVIGRIEAQAKGIAEAQVSQLTKKGTGGECIFRTPEEHLYTMQELTESEAFTGILTRWWGWGGRDQQVQIQSRRVITLLGAKDLRTACERPADCNAEPRCLTQGAFE